MSESTEAWIFPSFLKALAIEGVLMIALSVQFAPDICALIGSLGLALVGFLPMAWPEIQSRRDHQKAFAAILAAWSIFTVVHGKRALSVQGAESETARKNQRALMGGDAFPYITPNFMPNRTGLLLIHNLGDLPLTVTTTVFCPGYPTGAQAPLTVPAHFMAALPSPFNLAPGMTEADCFFWSVNYTGLYTQILHMREQPDGWQFEFTVTTNDAQNQQVTLMQTTWSDPKTGAFDTLPEK